MGHVRRFVSSFIGWVFFTDVTFYLAEGGCRSNTPDPNLVASVCPGGHG